MARGGRRASQYNSSPTSECESVLAGCGGGLGESLVARGKRKTYYHGRSGAKKTTTRRKSAHGKFTDCTPHCYSCWSQHSWDYWIHKHHSKASGEGAGSTTKKNKKAKTKYTMEGSGSRELKGWSHAGLTRSMNQLIADVRQDRARDNNFSK